jgi:hypothetical protein
MLSSQIDQEERKRVLDNDTRVREQGGTFHQHAVADASTPRGRFDQVNSAYVVGSKPDVAGAYPAASSAHQVQLPDEEPTGYRIDQMSDPVEPSSFFTRQVTGPTSPPSTPLGQRDVGPLSENMVAQRTLMASSTSERDDVSSGVGRPPFRRRV